MTCGTVQDLVFPYLCDAIEPVERRAVRDHLAGGCPRCQAALAEAGTLLALIPLALTPVKPPGSTKQYLMRRVRQDGRADKAPADPGGARAGYQRAIGAWKIFPSAIAALISRWRR